MTEPVTVYCLDEGMTETDDALDQDIATMIGVLRDQYSGDPDMHIRIAAALADREN